MWQMLADPSDAERFLAEAEARASGQAIEEVANHITLVLSEATEEAFDLKRDPRTHRAWVEASKATLHDRGFKSLLDRSGNMRSSVKTSYERIPIGARIKVELTGANDIVRRGMVHMYGIKKKAKRSNRSARINPRFFMPARRFIGMWREDVGATIEYAEKALMPESE